MRFQLACARIERCSRRAVSVRHGCRAETVALSLVLDRAQERQSMNRERRSVTCLNLSAVLLAAMLVGCQNSGRRISLPWSSPTVQKLPVVSSPTAVAQSTTPPVQPPLQQAPVSTPSGQYPDPSMGNTYERPQFVKEQPVSYQSRESTSFGADSPFPYSGGLRSGCTKGCCSN